MRFRLLIVDDDPVTLLALRDALLLKFSDAAITTADSAEQALSVMNTSVKFDVVLTDVRMPGLGGLLLLSEIRKRYPDCLVFVMTGHDPSLQAEALRQGASAFITKPLDMERLPRLLTRALDHATSSTSCMIATVKASGPKSLRVLTVPAAGHRTRS